MKRTREKISNLTTYRFGGVCENVVIIETIDDILQIEDEIHYDNFYILGKGSNVVFSDKDFDKLVADIKKAKKPARKTKTKDEKAISNFKNITNDFLIGMKKLIEYSSKHNVKFFDMVDDTTFENLEEIKMFLNSDDYKNVRTFSVEYQVDFNGKLEKAINQ